MTDREAFATLDSIQRAEMFAEAHRAAEQLGADWDTMPLDERIGGAVDCARVLGLLPTRSWTGQ
jgi:hypothetical protein